MKQILESDLPELTMRFKAILEIDNKIDESKSNIKNYNTSKKDSFKELAKKLEVSVKSLKEGYKEYCNKIQEPEGIEEKNEVFVAIQEFDLLGQEPKN